MSKKIRVWVYVLALSACGGGNQGAAEPTAQAEPAPTEEPPPATPPDDGQAVDEEVPPGLSVLTLLGGERIAAPAGVDMNRGKVLFDAFVDSFIELAAATAGAADCVEITGAWAAWRIKVMPTLQTDFATIDAYARSMSDADRKATEERMKPHLEKMMSGMMKCAQDAGFMAEMKQLEADFATLEKANQPADESADGP